MLSCYNTVLINALQEPNNKPSSFILNAQLSSSLQKDLQVISSPARSRSRRLALWILAQICEFPLRTDSGLVWGQAL